jgi:hypothetical protein
MEVAGMAAHRSAQGTTRALFAGFGISGQFVDVGRPASKGRMSVQATAEALDAYPNERISRTTRNRESRHMAQSYSGRRREGTTGSLNAPSPRAIRPGSDLHVLTMVNRAAIVAIKP